MCVEGGWGCGVCVCVGGGVLGGGEGKGSEERSGCGWFMECVGGRDGAAAVDEGW